ncbi:hypothetical protein LTR36_010452 [Oleoguttula mirabilis]|uniref:Uncharacterized protein n=1 Tax=Oleoguttula mirabilis TaxID=1507867 RepID=A0AAV9J4N4_9PEZI|nr:hypothetical protein LTR36_010452 [Oleoguttula mirabilis]
MAPPVPDYYLILDVGTGAKLWRIRAAGRQRKRELRAACYGSDDDQMEAVVEAVEALVDERERYEYDLEHAPIAEAWGDFLAESDGKFFRLDDSDSEASFVDDKTETDEEEEEDECMDEDGIKSDFYAEDSMDEDGESDSDLEGDSAVKDAAESDTESELDPVEYYRAGYLLYEHGVETVVEQLGRDYRCR